MRIYSLHQLQVLHISTSPAVQEMIQIQDTLIKRATSLRQTADDHRLNNHLIIFIGFCFRNFSPYTIVLEFIYSNFNNKYCLKHIILDDLSWFYNEEVYEDRCLLHRRTRLVWPVGDALPKRPRLNYIRLLLCSFPLLS